MTETTDITAATPPPHLTGNRAPVREELTAFDLPVTGELPPELTGTYLRNGPNPRDGSDHWFLGEGMVHGVRLEGGRASWYRNRWVRTDSFERDIPLYDPTDGHRNLRSSVANTHVVRHAGTTLALVESSLPYAIGADLETLGCHDFGGALRDSMTAHPKTCPTTGELHFFGYGSLTEPFVTYHRADAAGRITHERAVDVPGMTMMHDVALTAGYVIFLDLPVVFDLEVALAGAGMPFRWKPEYGARLGLLRRDDVDAPIRWCEIEPCYVFHVANAFERTVPGGPGDHGGHGGAGGSRGSGTRIVLQAVRYEHMWREGDFDAPGHLWEWEIDPATGRVSERQLDDVSCEFPRIDDRRTGLESRLVHTVAGDALLTYDTAAGTSRRHAFAPGSCPGEMTFVPAAGSRDERDGYLLGYVLDPATRRSDLVVLSAGDVAAEPLARVHLPGRVPDGFHGNWLADEG